MSKDNKEYLVRRAPRYVGVSVGVEAPSNVGGDIASYVGVEAPSNVGGDIASYVGVEARLDYETAPHLGYAATLTREQAEKIPGFSGYNSDYPVDRGSTAISDLVDTRETTHGDFDAASDWLEKATEMLETMPNWEAMASGQRQSLRMVVLKISRVGHGDFAEPDHYRDIAGYATLALRSCRKDADKEVS